jgi:hypothetical protein
VPEGLGKRKIGDAQPGEFNGLRIMARDDITNDHQIRDGDKVFRAVSFTYRDGEILKKKAHGGIDIVVRTGYNVPFLFQNAGKGGHPGPTNSHEVNMIRIWWCHIEGRGQGERRGGFVFFVLHFKNYCFFYKLVL